MIMPASTAVEAAREAHHYTSAAHCSTTLPQHFSQHRSKNVHQTVFSSLHLTPSLPAHSLQQASSSMSDSLVGGLHNLKRHCGHFNTISTLGRPLNPDTLEPGSGSQQQKICAHPASCFPLGFLHSKLWDMRSQDKQIISRFCLMISPMAFPRISGSLRQVKVKLTLHIRTCLGPTQCHCHLHL